MKIKYLLLLLVIGFGIPFSSYVYGQSNNSDSSYWLDEVNDILEKKTNFKGLLVSHIVKNINKYGDSTINLEDLNVSNTDKLYEVLYGIDKEQKPLNIKTKNNSYNYLSSIAFNVDIDNVPNTLSNPRYRNGTETRPLFGNGQFYDNYINTAKTDLIVFIRDVAPELCRTIHKGEADVSAIDFIPNKFDDDFEIPSFPKTFNNKNVTLKGSWGCIYTPKMLYLYKTIYIR